MNVNIERTIYIYRSFQYGKNAFFNWILLIKMLISLRFFLFFLGFRYRYLIKRHNIPSLRQEIRRQRRNNILLLLIVALYAISWLPFNISYILLTYAGRFHTEGLILFVCLFIDKRKISSVFF